MELVLACGTTVKNFQSAGSTFPVDFKETNISTDINCVTVTQIDTLLVLTLYTLRVHL